MEQFGAIWHYDAQYLPKNRPHQSTAFNGKDTLNPSKDSPWTGLFGCYLDDRLRVLAKKDIFGIIIKVCLQRKRKKK